MGNLKDQAADIAGEDIQQHKLDDSEVSYLRLLQLALQYHTLGRQIMTGFLYYVASHRLGYKAGVNLQFEFDFDKQDNVLTIRLLPADPAEAAAAANAAEQKAQGQ